MFGRGISLGVEPGFTCPVCGQTNCNTIYKHNDPLVKEDQGGEEMQSAHPPVTAPYAIEDPELERTVYSPGDLVPYEDAVKYGLVEAEAAPERAKKKTADRAKRLTNDRSKRPEKDR